MIRVGRLGNFSYAAVDIRRWEFDVTGEVASDPLFRRRISAFKSMRPELRIDQLGENH